MSIRPGSFARGVRLEQNKEPAYSREIKQLPFPEGQLPRTIPQGPEGYAPAADLTALTPPQVIRLARLADIVDENDGQLLWKKLEEAQKRNIYAVVVDAIDDEPYLSSQLNPMMKHGKEIVTALRLCAKAVAAPKLYVAVYKHLTDLSISIPRYVDDVRIKRIRGRYPAEFRSRNLFGENRRILLIGACALLFLYRAAATGQAQSTAIVTVHGNCVANPINLEVPLGADAQRVLEFCGLAQNPDRVVAGGPMTGREIDDPAAYAVTPTTRAILAFQDRDKVRRWDCIGCSRCTAVCPAGISPGFIYRRENYGHLTAGDIQDARRCTGCGACSYTCPAGLPLTGAVRSAAGQTAPSQPSRPRRDGSAAGRDNPAPGGEGTEGRP